MMVNRISPMMVNRIYLRGMDAEDVRGYWAYIRSGENLGDPATRLERISVLSEHFESTWMSSGDPLGGVQN